MTRRARHRHPLAAAVALIAALTVLAVLTPFAHAVPSPPSVTVDGLKGTEGQSASGTVATFTDLAEQGNICANASAYSTSVQWGDGDSDTPAATLTAGPDNNLCEYSITSGHTYREAGTYGLTVSVTGPNSPTPGTATGTATISDAPLDASCGPLTATAGKPLTGTVATFTDGNPDAAAGDFTATVDFGDGSSAAGTVSASPNGFTVTGGHTWASSGTYTVTTKINDAGGGSTQTSCAASVSATSTTTSTTTTTTGLQFVPTLTSTVAVATPGTLVPGENVHLTAKTTASPGVHVYEYRWDFNDDGHFDADTGSYPSASHNFAGSGGHTVRLETLGTDGSGHTISSMSTTNVISAIRNTAGCSGQLTLGFLDFLSQCIKDDNGKYSINLDNGVGFAGVELTSTHAGAKLMLDTTGTNTDNHNPDHKWLLTADGPVTISILNTTIGTIQLDTLDLQHSPIVLPIGANAPDQNAPGLRVFTFEAQSMCPAHSGLPPVVCAQVPGGFPLTGSVSIYVTAGAGDQPGAAVTANLAIQHPINITGNLTLTGDSSGVNVDSFGFSSPSFNIGSLVTVDPVMISYERRDPDSGDMDVWMASAGAHLHLSNSLGVTVALRFANGRFQSFSFNLMGVIPLGPVVLTQLGGTLGFDPLEIGANLGGRIGPVGITAGVLYTGESGSQPWHLQIGTEDPDHDPHHVTPLAVTYPSVNPLLKATGTLDLYGDGFISGGIDVNFGLPNADSPSVVNVGGFVHGWFSPPSASVPHPQYQISGGVHVDVHAIFHLYGDAQGLVNNYWNGGVNVSDAAGCGELGLDLGPFGQPSVGGWIRVDLAHDNHVDDGFGGCSNISAYCAPASASGSHTVPSCLGFDSVAASTRYSSRPQRFWIPAGEPVDNIKVSSLTGVPHVQITGPSGTYTTPTGSVATQVKPYIGGADASEHAAQIGVFAPKPGAYTITPLPGSPPIGPVAEAHPLPSPNVRVRVTGRGRVRVLHYALRTSPGQTIEFIERAGDVFTKIGTVANATGEISFRSQVAQSRSRTIEAQPFESGIPQKPVMVGHYTAPPPPRPGRPAKVHASRRANAITLTWSAVTGAEGYQVFVRGSDGRRQLYVTGGHVRRLQIKPVFDDVSLKVSVSAVGGLYHQPGRARALTVAKPKPKPPVKPKKKS